MEAALGIGIILAAGESKRMGSPKALLLYRGRTFLERIESGLLGAGLREVRVVVGEWAKGVRLPLARSKVLMNANPDPGPISSIRLALADVPSEVRFAVVALVDHPAVEPRTYVELVEQAREGLTVIPTFAGRGGHPVVFPREMFPHLLDPAVHSAREAIARFDVWSVRRWECCHPGVVIDIDTPERLDRLNDMHGDADSADRSTA